MFYPLVMVPGLRCDGFLYQPIIPRLGGSIAPVIADVSLDDSIAGMAGRILAAAPPRFALAGLSMGGYVVLEIMRQAPERVTHLALLDTNARPDSEERKQARLAEMELVRQGKSTLVSRMALPGLLAPAHLDGPVADQVHDMAMRVGTDTYMRQQTAIMGRIDSRPFLPGIAVPTLVGVGAEDKLIPLRLSEEMAELIPEAELVIFPDAGHVPTLENPAAVAEAMNNWLKR
ncbi:pimeloyl-ACP methyl ester carboxylesterase [Devosia subaequoris]|uniref:Pimeloyl-ACP methyl ester carboxylesterase n=1 Tax=Devosia subaequoris TaxID=395930 RepID=A0A7W6IN65_9HYPH|nr:alpha/beta fold hydrolase [Devosia subaequoris]MBB4052697.1 pimeloyl-ACP methyl ester carboxylesterase [Devosia subaequoris]MCP1209852.1 alpha/beta hydrolase [Devosia subaequoris]